MFSLLRLLARWPTEKMLHVACVVGLTALAIMCWGVLSGHPLPVVASMSVAQGLGVVGGVMFGLSIASEVAQRRLPER